MKIIKPLIVTLGTLLVFLVIIALLTPPLAKNYINKHSKELTGRKIQLEGLYLNIFTGYTRLTGFRMLEADERETFISFDTLTVDISFFRLLANELHINQIHLSGPDIRVLQNKTSFNFDDLLTPTSSQSDSVITPSSVTVQPGSVPESPADTTVLSTTSSAPGNSLVIAIYDIAIRNGHIYYEDQARQSVWEMKNFGLDIPGIYFSGQNTDVGLGLNFNNGGQLQTHMQYNLEAGNYRLRIDLADFSIAPIQPYLVDFLNISSINGTLFAHLDIAGNAAHITDFNVRGEVGLHQLALNDQTGHPVLSTDSIFMSMKNIEPEKSIFHFNTITANGIRTAFEVRKNGNTLSDLLKAIPEETSTTPANHTQNRQDSLPAASPAPDFQVAIFRVSESAFSFHDESLQTPFRFNLDHITVTADHLSLAHKNKAKINSTLPNGGTITFNYEGQLDELRNTDLLLNIKNLNLKDFTPYSMQYFGYPLTKGILSFSSINNIRNNQLEGRNQLNIARCEVGTKQKNLKPEYNIPLKTALYLIKDHNEQIKMELPVSGNIDSPEFSYRKIIIKTLTNLLVKVAVSPVSFLANSLGFSPDKMKNLPFEATQSDFTPEQLNQINQLAEIIKTKPQMKLLLEQQVDLRQSKTELARFYVKRNYYLQGHPGKNIETLLPIDYIKIEEINDRDPQFLAYVSNQVNGMQQTALPDERLLSLADSLQLEQLTHYLIGKRNEALKTYLLRQAVPEKCLRISTAPEEKLRTYSGKNLYTIDLILEDDQLQQPNEGES